MQNQPPLFTGYNLLTSDRTLKAAVERAGVAVSHADAQRLAALGAFAGSADAAELGRLANAHPPRLVVQDARGERADTIEFHPAYDALMRQSKSHGLHCSAWQHLSNGSATPEHAANQLRAAGVYLMTQVEAGHGCPITMTNAAIPALSLAPNLFADWQAKIFTRDHDPRLMRQADKAGVTFGMGMTERQGGTDVRSNETRATPLGRGGSGEPYRIDGSKWFMSAPMCDAFLILAQADGGLSCFLLPRVLDDGTVNAIHFQRLKDKLGNRSNASSEVAFDGATAFLIGEEGRGIAAIMEMVTSTRLDCAVASAALMRNAVARATHHARHRTVFQKKLVDQPLMQHVLADLALDAEAATVLSFRLAQSFDGGNDPLEHAWRRIMTPVTKYWVCKRVPAHVYEAMECLGGNGYVEDWTMARLYREAPLNAIWEGSGNVMALDLLRAWQRERDSFERLIAHFSDIVARHRALAPAFERLHALFNVPDDMERRGREAIEGLVRLAAASLLIEHAPKDVSDAFVATRLNGGRCDMYGQGLGRADCQAIVSGILV